MNLILQVWDPHRVNGMRLLTRALILLTAASLIFLLLVGRCGLRIDEELAPTGSDEQLADADQFQKTLSPESYYISILHRREEEHRAEIKALKEEIANLKRKVCNILFYRFTWKLIFCAGLFFDFINLKYKIIYLNRRNLIAFKILRLLTYDTMIYESDDVSPTSD